MSLKKILILVAVFLIFWFVPFGSPKIQNAIMESLFMAKEYAQLHIVVCLLPAILIAGAVGVFLKQNAIMKYLGVGAKKITAYAVASVSGAVLAVCSCTILPLFSGIYKKGAGLGPAATFLYAGPAINILAIILTGRILGLHFGIARALGAILFSIIIGVLMQTIFKNHKVPVKSKQIKSQKPAYQTLIFFGLMILFLVFANWAPAKTKSNIWEWIFNYKWVLSSIFAFGLGICMNLWYGFKLYKVFAIAALQLILWLIVPELITLRIGLGLIVFFAFLYFDKSDNLNLWYESSSEFAGQILPLLFIGVLIAGLLLGRPGHQGLINPKYIASITGTNSILSNLFASVAGAFMYFATLTEIPILQGLIGAGMAKGPAMALLLAGPALSLPNMLVIKSIMGTKKTLVFVCLVVVMATISGFIFGHLF